MKLLILAALFAIAFAQAPPPPQYQLHIPGVCEDVLAFKVCERLRKTAATLKLKSEEVKTAVVEAYKQGKVTAEEIEKAVNDFLVNKVMNKKCEDLTSAENCVKLQKLAAQLNVAADKVKEFIVKEIAILKTKTCEDLLDVTNCNKLKDLAGKLKIKTKKLEEILIDAYLEAKSNGKAMLEETYNKVKTYVMSTRCEDMFNPDLCISFRKYAEKTKVALPKILETAFYLVKKGVVIGKGLVTKVFNIVDFFYDCTDVFDQTSCDRLKKWAAKLQVTANEFEIIIRKYVRMAIEKGTPIYHTIKEFVRSKILCKFSSKFCGPKAEDVAELEINKRSLSDWRSKIIEIIDTKFPNLEANVRKALEDLVIKSKSLWELLRTIAIQIKANISDKYNEILKTLMIEATL